MSLTGMIYNIQRFSIQDGPGIRTTIFLKGCPLKCLWCSNPESQSRFPQLLFFKELCSRCRACIDACKQSAVTFDGEKINLDRQHCIACGSCVPKCPSDARSIAGRKASIDELLKIASKDYLHYLNSGGGITVGGGEPFMQPDFLYELLKVLHDEGFHTCVDTCFYTSWNNIERVLPVTDLFLVDCKHMDSDVHKRITGADNACILDNLRRLSHTGSKARIRIPLIPSYNDSRENLMKAGEFLSGLGFLDVDVIPYHKFGYNKYNALDKLYVIRDVPQDSGSRVQILKDCGLNVQVI